MKIGLGDTWIWRLLFRLGLARARMPQWRVIVEGRPKPIAGHPQAAAEGAVVSILVWAHEVEEAEGLAQIVVERDGFATLTADAIEVAPQTRPSAAAMVAARSKYLFYA